MGAGLDDLVAIKEGAAAVKVVRVAADLAGVKVVRELAEVAQVVAPVVKVQVQAEVVQARDKQHQETEDRAVQVAADQEPVAVGKAVQAEAVQAAAVEGIQAAAAVEGI